MKRQRNAFSELDNMLSAAGAGAQHRMFDNLAMARTLIESMCFTSVH